MMKKIFLITFFVLLFSLHCFGAEDFIKLDDISNSVTFEDAKNAASFRLFSNTYAETENYYDQLTEYEKKYYDDLEANIMSLTDGKTTYTFKTDLYIAKGLTSSNEIFASAWDTLGTDASTFIYRPLYALTYMDKPQYFWIEINNLSVKYGSKSGYYPDTGLLKDFYITYTIKSGYESYLPSCYESGEQVTADYDAIMAKANEIINSVPENSSQWGKLNYYMNWLRDNCQYNYSTSMSKHAFLPTSGFLYGKEEINSPVCEGYSEALKILCDMSGIKSMCTESFYEDANGNKAGHKWNLINMNGKFYHCDPTWFDRAGIGAYNYFLTGSDNIARYDSTPNHTIVYQMKYVAPEISSTDYLEDIGINGYRLLNTDGNNIINQKDIADFMKIISGISSGNANDINNDGRADIGDAITMEKLMFE